MFLDKKDEPCWYVQGSSKIQLQFCIDQGKRNSFFDKCNRGLVNLERITTEEIQPHRKYLKEILEKHYKYTKRDKARELLDDFERYEPFFWLVVPAASNIQDLLKATTANAA